MTKKNIIMIVIVAISGFMLTFEAIPWEARSVVLILLLVWVLNME